MNEIKTDLFPENLRAARNDMGKQVNGVHQDSISGAVKEESEYKDTMTPAEPLPESERPRKDGPGGE